MLAFAAAEKLHLAPVGGGTRATLGNPTQSLDLLVSTSRLDRITEYAPDDFVVTVQAGVRLSRLQAALAPQAQWFPLDPPATDPSTLGGILSADASGPHRFLHGTARDLVIGVEAALPNGTVVRSGGRVVKNVAGYDFKKLFIGAIGTLGVITSVSLKLQVIPEDETLIAAGFPDFKSAGAAAGA
ncbi:MAG: FAD-binding oxidoreductase, partial [Deltaproteobacteria bacterium]|nr:FAD-binding oxidoreductase [Deltaproteobacteria bacterium]